MLSRAPSDYRIGLIRHRPITPKTQRLIAAKLWELVRGRTPPQLGLVAL
jgi:hypothetical protein